MMKKILVLLCIIPVLAHGQTKEAPNVTWKHIYGGKKSEAAHCVISNYVGQILVAGETNSPPAQKTDGFLMLLGPKGDTIFQKMYGGAGDDVIEAMVQTYDGNFVLAGHTTSFGNGQADAWILKVNELGDTLWQRALGSSGNDEFRDIIQTSDGHLVAVGSTSANGREDTWVYKMYDDGGLIWQQTFGNRGLDKATGIAEGKDGNYGITGITSSGKGSRNIWLFVLNKEGKPQYHQLFGSRQYDEVFSIVATTDGGYALAGYAKTVSENQGSGLKDMWVIKTDYDAQEIWSKTYGGKSNEGAFDMVETPDGGLVLAGYTYSHVMGANTPKAMLIKVQGQTGKLIWEQKPEFGGTGTDELHALVLMPDGSLVLAGQTDSKQEGAKSQDIWVIRLDPEYIPTTTLETNVVVKDIQIKGIKNGVLTEHDDAYLLFTLENSGTEDAFAIDIALQDKAGVPGLSFPKVVRAGFLGVGQSKKFNLPLRAKKVEKVATARLEIQYSDESRSRGKSDEIPVTIQPAVVPSNFLQVEWVNPGREEFPAGKKDVKMEKVSIKVLVRSDKPLKTSDFTVYLNNKPYNVGQKSGEAGLRPKNNQQDASGMYLYNYTRLITVGLGTNELEVVVANDAKKESTGKFTIVYNDKPNLHVISLGIQHDDLLFTTKDAQDFAASFQKQDGAVFDKVYMRTLISGDSTRAGQIQTDGDIIKQAFADLKEKYNYTIYERDFLVLFISSHGRSVNNSFKIVPTDFVMVGEKALIDFQSDVIEQIDKITCNKLIFIDACQSGTIGVAGGAAAASSLSPEDLAKEQAKEKARLQAQAKTIVAESNKAATTSTLASCDANESSWEDKEWGNGAFTRAILGAFHNEEFKDDGGPFRPSADDDVITLGELVAYIDRRVPQMIKDAGKNGTQHPFISQEQLLKVKDIPLFKINQ